MKEFYIFDVKEEFYKLYKNKPSELFYIYNRIYNMKKSNKEYGFNLFTQISNFLDKNRINSFLNCKYKDELKYSYNDNQHIFNNLFFNEITILLVKSSNIKIESNVEFPEFFKILKKIDKTYFVCDFKNQDYFFLNSIKNKNNVTN